MKTGYEGIDPETGQPIKLRKWKGISSGLAFMVADNSPEVLHRFGLDK